MTFTQAICDDCWTKENGARIPHRLTKPEREVCCMCGTTTTSGVYTRKDPKTVPFPTLQDDMDKAHRRDYDFIGLSRKVQAMIGELRQTSRVRETKLDGLLAEVEAELQKARDHVVAVWD